MYTKNIDINEKIFKELQSKNLSLGEFRGNCTGYASIDKPWQEVYREFNLTTINCDKSIFQFLEECTKDKLNLTALTMLDKNNNPILKVNYNSYLKGCTKTANSFDKLGIKETEIVPIILPNIPESRFSIYGLNYIGGISYPILPSLPAKELEKILIENDIHKIVLFTGFYEKYKDVLKNCHIDCIVVTDGTGLVPSYIKKIVNAKAKLKGEKEPFNNYKDISYNPNIITWDELNRLKSLNFKRKISYTPNSTATIIGTSGTTGVPKGAKFTNESINYQAYQHLLADINYEVGDKILDILIQSISYGFSVMHYSGCFGLNSVIIPNLITDKIAEVMHEVSPDHFTGGPIHFEYIKNSSLYQTGELKPLKNAISGGAKLPKETEAYLNKNEVYVRQGYGTTECQGGATGPKGEYQLGSLGIPLPLTTMAIFKPGTDEELTYNQTGEICISGPTIMQEYLNRKEETDNALMYHKDGNLWLHTKDLGYCDSSGHFYFEDRISDTFMRCGFNIHPNKIAEFLNSTKYVSESYVTGVEHGSEQQVPVAFIVLNEQYVGKEELIKNELYEECFTNLDEFAIPYEFIFVENLPRNLGGKIERKTLIEKHKIDYSSCKNTKSFALTKEKK